MADESARQDDSDQHLFAGRGARSLNWAVIGAGFLLGVLVGAIVLIGRGGESARSSEVSARSASAVPGASTSTTARRTSGTDRAANNLTAERDRLEQELKAAKLRHEVETLRRRLFDLESSPVSVETPSPRRAHNRSAAIPQSASRTQTRPASGTAAASVSPGDATLAYWNQMNTIILQEAAMRSAPVGGLTAANAAGFLDARMRAAEFAVDAIRRLDASGVDARVVKLGEQLADWYEEGRTVAETGRQLLRGASVQERQGSLGKRYQDAERSHAKRVNALNAEGEQTRQAMSRKYRLNFPPLN